MFETKPANENISFSSLIRNPVREKAKAALARTLYDLELDGVPPSLLSELLFEFLMIEMEPDDPITSETAITWFSQLNRFKDSLQSKVDDIEHAYEESEN